MRNSKQDMNKELGTLLLIPLAVLLLGYVALWSRAVTLRITSQMLLFSGYSDLALPLAERAVRMNAAQSGATVNEKLWCVWTLGEIYRAQHRNVDALQAYKVILAYNAHRGANPSFMQFQAISHASESLLALGKAQEAAEMEKCLVTLQSADGHSTVKM